MAAGGRRDGVADRALELRRYEHSALRSARRCSAGDRPEVRARIDPQQLLQAILNLIVNAEQAVGRHADGVIRVSVVAEERARRVTVADNGPGLGHATSTSPRPS